MLDNVNAMTSIIISVFGILSAFVLVGKERQRLDDLIRRYEELARELRERVSTLEHKVGTLEQTRAQVAVELESIKMMLARVETKLDHVFAPPTTTAAKRKR